MKINKVHSNHIFNRYAGEMHFKKLNDGYRIDSPCILSENKVIKIGLIYLLTGFNKSEYT